MTDMDPSNQTDRHTTELVSHELGNPSKQLLSVFLLIGVIPVLALVYIVRMKFSVDQQVLHEIGPVLFFATLIMTLGYVIGYKVVDHIVRKILAYASEAKRADELKSSFAMSLAHDLKSPLLVIKANISNLKAGFLGALDPKQEQTINTCKDVTNRMNQLIMDLIDTYKIEARMAEITRSRFDLQDIVREQLRECEAIASKKKIVLDGELASQPLPFEGDRTMILRAMNNLLSNAIKYTPAGGQVVFKTTSSDGFAHLECLNSGPTIPAEKLVKIFDKFERLDGTTEGQGLGLAITKDIVELHNGRIWATSQPWQLNCFTIMLPLSVEP